MSDFSASVIQVVEGAQPAPDADFTALALDRGGALVTAGTGNTYTVRTKSSLTAFGPGLALLLKVDRSNTGPAFLAPDGLAPRPWLDAAGAPFAVGQLQRDRFVWAIPDPARDAWISDIFGGLTVALLNAVLDARWLALPTAPDGIGPNAAWRNGGLEQRTDENNPDFTLDSPEGRRLWLKKTRDALPTSPDGLGPEEPWLSGDSIAFTPKV